MSELIQYEIMPSADGRDGNSSLPPENEQVNTPLDAIEQREGEYFEDTEKTVLLNWTALAQRYAQHAGVCWDDNSQQLRQYSEDTGVWKPKNFHQAVREVNQLVKTLARERDIPLSKLNHKVTPQMSSKVIETLKGYSSFGDNFDHEPRLLLVKNGVLDLSGSKPKLRAPQPEDRFTAQMPVNLKPMLQCPRWVEDLLKPALKHEDDLPLLQRVLGSMLVAGNPAQGILVLTGKGGTGKSTAISVFEAIIGTHRMAHLRTEQLSTRFETHSYQGKDLLVAKDVTPDFLQNGGSSLKWLTGADRIETEQKFGGKHHLEGKFNVIVTANELPLLKIAGDAEAWLRRMIPIEFSKSPSERIANFDKVLLEEEGDGILCWLVEGYLAAREEILRTGFFSLTEEQKTRRQDFVNASQSEVVFVRDALAPGTNDMSVEEIYHAYAEMCREHGWKPLSERKLQNALGELMLTHHGLHRSHDIKRDGKSVRGFRGIAVKRDATEAP
ncbi:P4 family phage/plasmid primase-like protein [Roseimicrobium gellanilyticum]|uniref:P4 family phage/plasmid primase-like protein n=1 Tax=Roseimicrobium gellanilyticum TaxID=748857 RepID=A0A366HH09_9BACT|nr:phage/plasmid primase, P4 family [Roseimicrobium gellanilyticum]RBP41471.1 P4 family phage/plasmid primase-like protein [Roseimicrobium gellanilyticum]